MGFWDWLFRRRPSTPPKPVVIMRTVVVRTGVPGAEVRINDAPPDVANANGDAFTMIGSTVTTFNLNLQAPNMSPYDFVVTKLRAGAQHLNIGDTIPITTPLLEVRLPPWKLPRPFPAEVGLIRQEGRYLVHADGTQFQWRGVSMFLLPGRFLRGDNITPTLDWCEANGFNVLRCWDGVPAGFKPERYGFPHPSYLWSGSAGTDQKLGEFFDLFQRRGLRCEYTVLTYQDDLAVMRARMQRIYNLVAGRPLVFVEGGNEVENNQIDIYAVMDGIERHGTVSAYGNDPARHCHAQDTQEGHDSGAWTRCMQSEIKNLNYGTAHDLRRDQNSARVTKDSKEWQDLFGCPYVDDEPLGVIDSSHPWFQQHDDHFWGAVGGGGRRTTNLDYILSAAAISAMMTAGYTYHPQCGLEGRHPNANEPIQALGAELLCKLHQFIPPHAKRGDYSRPGHGPFPFTWTDGDTDSKVTHAYASIHGNTAWAVLPLPRDGWAGFTAANGWRLDATCPGIPYVARFTR